jgi:hypothetical protein
VDQNEERYVSSLENYVRQLESEIQDYQLALGFMTCQRIEWEDTYQGA